MCGRRSEQRDGILRSEAGKAEGICQYFGSANLGKKQTRHILSQLAIGQILAQTI
jgi:hypothetical protein